MPICPRCYRGELHPYSNEHESWTLHCNPIGSLFTLAKPLLNDGKFTDILRCDNGGCKVYGFCCPHCGEVDLVDVHLKHGHERTCKSCRREIIIRNPSNLFSTK